MEYVLWTRSTFRSETQKGPPRVIAASKLIGKHDPNCARIPEARADEPGRASLRLQAASNRAAFTDSKRATGNSRKGCWQIQPPIRLPIADDESLSVTHNVRRKDTIDNTSPEKHHELFLNRVEVIGSVVTPAKMRLQQQDTTTNPVF